MTDSGYEKAVRGFINNDPFSALAFSKMLSKIQDYSPSFEWSSQIDYADLFFNIYQDSIKNRSEKELNKMLSLVYYRLIYRDYFYDVLKRNNEKILLENHYSAEQNYAHIDTLCNAIPDCIELRLMTYCAGKNEDKADQAIAKFFSPFKNDYSEYLRYIFESLIACGCMAKIFFAANAASRIDEKTDFGKSILSLNQQNSYQDALRSLYEKYKERYWNELRIDDRFLFDCAVTIFLNRMAIGADGNKKSSNMSEQRDIEHILNEWTIKRAKQKITPNDYEHEILLYINDTVDNPRLYVHALGYSQYLVKRYSSIAHRKVAS